MNTLKKLNDWYERSKCRFCIFFPWMLVTILCINHDLRKLIGASWLIWVGISMLLFATVWGIYRALIFSGTIK